MISQFLKLTIIIVLRLIQAILVRGQVNKFLENLSEGTRSVMSHYFLTSFEKFIAWFHFCKRLKRTTFLFFAKWKKTSFVQWSTYERFNAERNQNRVNNVYSTFVPASVYNWMNEFKRGLSMWWYIHMWCTSFRTSNWGCYARNHKVYDIVLTDWRVKVRKSLLKILVDMPGISYGNDFNFARTIGYEKAIGKIGAAHCDISAIVWRFQNNVWRCFNVIQMDFYVDSLLWTKHGSITSHPRQRNSQNNGLHQVNQLRRRRRS